MSELEAAIERLERAIARLEAACASATPEARREAEKQRLRAIAGELAKRVDGALAMVSRALGEEG